MKVEIKTTVEIGGTVYAPGAVVTVADALAKSLIGRGLAQEKAEAPKPVGRPPKTDKK